MGKLLLVLIGAVTIAGGVFFLFGVNLDRTKPPARAVVVPPISSAPAVAPSAPRPAAEQQPELICKGCPNPREPTLLDQDGLSVTVSAALVPESQAEPGAPPTATVKVKVRSKTPAKVVPKQNYIILSPENGRDYSLPVSEYRFVTSDGQSRGAAPDPMAAPDEAEPSLADSWPAVDDTVESELEFQFNVDLVTGRFMVRAPDLMVNGKSYALPPVTFEPKQ